MSANSPTLYTVEYANTLQMLAQQVQSKLMATVTVGSGHTGKQASPVDQYGAIEVTENSGRFEAMPRSDLPFDRRWVFPTNWDVNQLFDKNDLIRMMVDPKAAGARAAVAAMNRRRDRTIIDGLVNANYTGETGTTSTTLGSGQVVGVNTGGTASGMNVAKLRAALQILLTNDVDVDAEELYVVVDAAAHIDLLTETQITSQDYNPSRDGVPVLQNGKIASFLGFNFVHCERLTEFNGTDDQAGTSTPVMAYAKSGVYFGGWKDMQVDVKERPDLRGIPWQIYTAATFGATRLEEDKVVKIWSR